MGLLAYLPRKRCKARQPQPSLPSRMSQHDSCAHLGMRLQSVQPDRRLVEHDAGRASIHAHQRREETGSHERAGVRAWQPQLMYGACDGMPAVKKNAGTEQRVCLKADLKTAGVSSNTSGSMLVCIGKQLCAMPADSCAQGACSPGSPPEGKPTPASS